MKYAGAAASHGEKRATSVKITPFPLLRTRLLCIFPRSFRQWHRPPGGLHRLGACRGAVANASGNALGDAGEPEQIVSIIPVQVRDTASPGGLAVDLSSLLHGRNVERREIQVGEPRHGPLT